MDKLKTAVVGSRSITDKEKIFSTLDKNLDKIEYIVSGGAEGVDSLAQEYCKDRGIPIKIFYPKWYDEKGEFFKGAGFVRNKLIVEESDYILCFWDRESKGCMNSVDWAKKLDKPYTIIECDNPLKDYYIFASSKCPLSPFHKSKFTDKSKNIEFESIYQGYSWYFAHFIKNDNLKKEIMEKNIDVSEFVNEKLINKWNDWVGLELKVLRYLYKLKSIFDSSFIEELDKAKSKKIIFANLNERLGCGLKRNEIKVDNLGNGLNLVGKVLEGLGHKKNESN